jgi:light-regulated signal transduction histidine kinase (bacteriophytochrome)
MAGAFGPLYTALVQCIGDELLDDFADALNLWAHADPHLARTLVDNLVGNAWKFTSKTPLARIEAGAAGMDGGHAFFVRDNGAGFDLAHAEKLFVPFQRLHNATGFAGTGIGLATTQRIVHRHGGRIWANATAGSGALGMFWPIFNESPADRGGA